MNYLQKGAKYSVLAPLACIALAAIIVITSRSRAETITFKQLHDDTIINADLWSTQPEMLSAGFGFDGIIGIEGDEAEVRAAGGAWNTVTCANGEEPPRNVLTSAAPAGNLDMLYDNNVTNADGLPIVFSYPVLPSTVDHTDFLITLNTGATMIPDAASIYPNWEYNERHVVVVFGDVGNRLLPDEEGAIYPIKVEVVEDDSPLMLVGPEGLVSAVGLFKESDSTPYVSGPYLVGAKLNRFSDEGEDGPNFLARNVLPNDGRTLYGDAAQYRLRVYTSGGFSPDGVRGLRPDEYEHFFRLHATGENGDTILVTTVGESYTVAGGTLQVVGLADLGKKASEDDYDDCYVEDHDNYVDIILAGDEAAMRNITFVEIPATGDYWPFYNPGGPGNNPTPDVRYTAPGPADLEPVIMALDDPMTVTYED